MILDTCFLIDLQRELRKGVAGPATNFLKTYTSATFRISVIAATALTESLPLVTRNIAEFSRVEGLELVGY